MKEYLFFQNHKHHLQKTKLAVRPKTSDAAGFAGIAEEEKLDARLAEIDNENL